MCRARSVDHLERLELSVLAAHGHDRRYVQGRLKMLMLTAEVRRLIAHPNYAHIATLMPDGAPHSVPVWIDLEGDNLAILTGPGSRKARNLERDPRLAISIIDIDQPYASALIRGQVVEFLEG